MTDEKYEFIQDIKEKKDIAKSAYNKKRSGGKHVKFPSDYLSKKELKKMNGDIMSYKLNEPMTWKDFKALPDDLKKEYISFLIKEFNLYGKTIATELFNITYQSMGEYLRKNNCSIGSGGNRHRKEKIEEFRKWIKKENYDAPLDNPYKIQQSEEYSEDKIELPIYGQFTSPTTGFLTFKREYVKNIYAILKELLIEGCQYDITISFDKSEPLNNNYIANG